MTNQDIAFPKANDGPQQETPSFEPWAFPRNAETYHKTGSPKILVITDVQSTLRELLEKEVTGGKHQITIEDKGPKAFTVDGENLQGTYVLSNLLQELYSANRRGQKKLHLNECDLYEPPNERLLRSIKNFWWSALTRRMDGSNIGQVAPDPKDWTANPVNRVYVPSAAPEQHGYYSAVAKELGLEVHKLPPREEITAGYIRDLNQAPGILALAMEEVSDPTSNETKLAGVPFVVPGGRFNELYGWDSYFINQGLILSGQYGLARGILINFIFCIKHYGKILNANRTYYLGRSQPPFVTSMVLELYDEIKEEPGAKDLLQEGLAAAIHEYYTIWATEPRLHTGTGLSRYSPIGIGVPPETEASHFDHILGPYAEAEEMEIPQFIQKYNEEEVEDRGLHEYFRHDRAARESGHDTSYRLDGCTADLATVDLNSMLYKYEKDIAYAIRTLFNNELQVPKEFQTEQNSQSGCETAEVWEERAESRRAAMNRYMWDNDQGMYSDYNCVKDAKTGYESVTTLLSMWAGVASEEQAARLVEYLSRFEEYGGLASTTLKSRGETGPERPNRQWDYPYGWAPHQTLAWTGLLKYGYLLEARRLAYKWAYMITRVFADYNGTVVEKYDVTTSIDPHKVSAEYGNQGLDFEGVPPEGFGWVNASHIFACTLLTREMREQLNRLVPYDELDQEIINASAVKEWTTLAISVT